jgi:hypothetical protein
MERLATLSAPLAEQLRASSIQARRAATVTACEFAVTRSGLNDPVVSESLATLRTGGSFSPEQQDRLTAAVEVYDGRYFALQEAADEGTATSAQVLRAFSMARAVASLSFAASGDASEPVGEAIYEATATTDTPEELFKILRPLL